MKTGFLTYVVFVLLFLMSTVNASAWVQDSTIGIPAIGNVGDQQVLCDENFNLIDLKTIVTDPDHSIFDLRFEVYGSLMLAVTQNNGVVTVHNPHKYSRTEVITFRVTDPEGFSDKTSASFTVLGCHDNDVIDPVVLPGDEPDDHPGHTTPYDHGYHYYDNNLQYYHDDFHGGHGGYYEEHYEEYFGGYRGRSFFPDNFAIHPPRTCAISTGHGLLQDLDCDDVPDPVDNCLDVPNPSQADQNYNGIGDACDIAVAQLDVNPDKLSCGRSVVVNAAITNNQPVSFDPVKVTARIKKLGIESTEYVQLLPGSASAVELTSRIPLNAKPGIYDLELELEYMMGGTPMGTGAVRQIKVGGESCTEAPTTSFLDVKEIQDVKPGEQAVFAMKIKNTEKRANSYTFIVKDVEDFGSYSIEPGSLVIIPAESQQTIYLNVWADENMKAGARTFVLEVHNGDELEQIVLVANIIGEETVQKGSLSWILIALILVGAFFVVLLALMRAENVREWHTKGLKRSKHLPKEFEVVKVEKKKTLPEPSNNGVWNNADKQKVALTGIIKERGWLYFVDKQGDVSRSRMTWAK